MLFDNGTTTEQLTALITEARDFFRLQSKHIALQTTEVLTRLLAAIALWGTIVLIGSLVLLFGSFALAYSLGNLLGSAVWGFAIIAAVLLLLCFIVYANRTAWIVVPVAKFMVSLFASSMQNASREAVAMEKARVQADLDKCQTELHQTASSLFTPQPETRDNWERATRLVSNSMSIYRGVQFGLSAITAFRTVFKLGRKRRSK